MLAVLVAFIALPQTPATAQTPPPPTSATASPAQDLVAQAPPDTTNPAGAPPGTTPANQTAGSPTLSAATKLRLIVGALIALVVIVAGLTIAYIRHTTPTGDTEATEPDTP